MTTETKQTAETAYADTHSEIVALAEDINDQIFGLMVPSDAINWGHVGDLNEIARQLRDVLARIKGEQR